VHDHECQCTVNTSNRYTANAVYYGITRTAVKCYMYIQIYDTRRVDTVDSTKMFRNHLEFVPGGHEGLLGCIRAPSPVRIANRKKHSKQQHHPCRCEYTFLAG